MCVQVAEQRGFHWAGGQAGRQERVGNLDTGRGREKGVERKNEAEVPRPGETWLGPERM